MTLVISPIVRLTARVRLGPGATPPRKFRKALRLTWPVSVVAFNSLEVELMALQS